MDTLEKFLRDNLKDYINSDKFFSSSSKLTEKDRDAIDTQTKNFTKECCQHIDSLKAILGSNESKRFYNPQSLSHLHHVVTLLYYRLQALTEYFSEQRTVRLRHSHMQERFSKPLNPAIEIAPPDSNQADDLQLDDQERK